MKKTFSIISEILYLVCSISALILGVFSLIDYCPSLKVSILIVNVFLFGLTYFLNRDKKWRLNLFSIETIIGYLGIMFLFLNEQAYYEITSDSFDYYNAVGNIELWLLASTIITIFINILYLFDKQKKFKKIFHCYYITLFFQSAIALIYLLSQLI